MLETQKFKNKSLYFASLGCSKNLVDSQVMLGHLGLDGFTISSEPENAEVIIVNTCSFIEAENEEKKLIKNINAIELLKDRKSVV